MCSVVFNKCANLQLKSGLGKWDFLDPRLDRQGNRKIGLSKYLLPLALASGTLEIRLRI